MTSELYKDSGSWAVLTPEAEGEFGTEAPADTYRQEEVNSRGRAGPTSQALCFLVHSTLGINSRLITAALREV